MQNLDTSAVLGLAALVALAPLSIVLARALSAYRRYRGRRVVVCPEKLAFTEVEVDAGAAAFAAPYGPPRLRLKSCTHWPERWPCGEECLAQVKAAPEACLVRKILTDWYVGKACLSCGRQFGPIRWHDHEPALAGPTGDTVAWKDVPVERLLEVLFSHRPVCWSCHGAETFRREHPELVTDRPPRASLRPRVGA
jgi:hypothetical protein